MTGKQDSDKHIDELQREKIDDRSRRIKRKSDRGAVASVMDTRTLFTFNDFLNKGIIESLVGIISAGKEANVYLGKYEDHSEIAIKVYKIDSNCAKWMREYLLGDPRFTRLSNSTSHIIFTWARKEFKNLKRAHSGGIPVPNPLAVKDNVLLMEFIGGEGTPAPRLKDIEIEADIDPYYQQMIGIIRDLYKKANLVHGDLSEFNILYWKGKLTVIDMSQSVMSEHPKARFYLARDIKNINAYFEKRGAKIRPPMEIYEEIVRD
jgi:RIO kinase 1